MKKEFIVLSVGGSLLNDGKPNKEMCDSIAAAIRSTETNCAIVCGGGKEARISAEAARKKYKNEFDADLAGIKITHKNAEALRKSLGKDAGTKIFYDFQSARAASNKQRYVLMGGTIPGITTDADAALLAEALKAKKLINVSKTAIYDLDPTKNKKAKRFSKMTYSQLIDLATKNDKRKAGTHFIFDLLACTLISRSNIQTHFIDGRDLSQLINAILGEKHDGTIVSI
jgi:uridylate kinase